MIFLHLILKVDASGCCHQNYRQCRVQNNIWPLYQSRTKFSCFFIVPKNCLLIFSQAKREWTDRYICPLPSLLAVVTSAILRGYIGSLTYFYQHFPIPPLGQKQHPFEGQGRKICSLPVCCPLHVSSRGHYSMGSVIHTHRHKNTNHFIDSYNTHGFSTCMRIQHKLF